MVLRGGDEAKERMNNAAKIFLERAREYDEMIEEAGAEYRIGMRHLANMMGSDPETFTQADADVSEVENHVKIFQNFFYFHSISIILIP